jgi:undecaprenyl diphosphate synthase
MMSKIIASEIQNKPRHVAIIMDGNGRWATARGMPRIKGHQAGTENLRQIISASVEFGIPYLTIYAFSTENWRRPKDEVDGLMRIFADAFTKELGELNRQGVQLRHIGRLDKLNPSMRKKVLNAIEITKNNNHLILSIAFNYGGRDEIVCAIRSMIEDGVKPEEINDELVSKYLFTAGTPDPDLVIRTSGEMRTSNFLVWQAVYSEWYITPTLWPDFNREEFRKALDDYSHRDRRFGRVTPCVESNPNAG